MGDVVVIDGNASLLNVLDGDSSLSIPADGDPGVSIIGRSGTLNYNNLYNKPSINGVELIGNRTLSDLGMLAYNHATTAEWNTHRDYIPQNNEICIYDDYKTITDSEGNEKTIKGFKIGDGKAYLIDLPFCNDDINETLSDHINNNIIHTNALEKAAWYSKLSCDGVVDETLLFS